MRTFLKSLTVLAGLAVVAAPAVAQDEQTPIRERPGFHRGMMGGGMMAMGRGPGSLLLERRAELNLTDEQVRQIETVVARVQRENAPRLEQLRAAFGDRNVREMSAEERTTLRERMRELQPVRDQVRASNRAAAEEIRAVLTAEQQEQVRQLRRVHRPGELRTPGPRPHRDGEWQNRRGDRRGGGEFRRPARDRQDGEPRGR